MIPSVQIQKGDGGTGVVSPSDVGVLAIIAPSSIGTPNVAQTFLRSDSLATALGGGPLVEAAVYALPVTTNPVVCVKGTATTAGAYGAVTHVGSGASVCTPGATAPYDDYDVLITIVSGGTIGAGPISYTYSLDGGLTTSAILALGAATSIVIADANVTLNFTSATVVTGDTFEVKTTAPADTNADLLLALEALRVTAAPWECVLVHGIADANMVTTVAAWLSTIALQGKFKTAVLTCRPRNLATNETEAAYATALAAIFAASVSTDIVVCADVGDVISPIVGRATSGITQARPTGWAIAARGMRVRLGTDVAYVELGPVPGFKITDARNNPKYHDEYMYPGLDALRLSTLRTFDGKQGAYITNANLISASGSDYVYWQHARCVNRASEIAFQVLTNQLSRGVNKNPKPGPNGERYIAAADALRIEGLANAAIQSELTGQVDGLSFLLSRNDDISSNQGATVHGQIQVVSLGYIKKFAVTIGFVKSLGQ